MSSNTNIPYVIKTNGSVSLYLNGECMTVAQDHPNYSKIVDALKNGEHNKIENLVNIAKAVTNYARGQVRVDNGQVFYGNFALHNTLTERILKMMTEGFKVDHMLRFLDNLMANPSFRAVNETYTFLENYGLPITEDGCFLAYKAVRNDYTDIRTGKFDNKVGQVVKMLRNQVNENYQEDCSYGLHVGSLGYVVDFGHFVKGQSVGPNGNRLLVVKVNPKDVVSVPHYAGHTKMRVCEYVVVDEIKDVVKELDKVTVYKADATPAEPDNDLDDGYNDDWDDDNWNEEPEDECNSCQKTEPRVDTTSPWNESAYREGFRLGQEDLDSGMGYGFSRDYTRENSYRIGYNDAYNERPNQANQKAKDISSNNDENDDYNAGYDLGTKDAKAGLDYEFSLDIGESNTFKNGYSDGYNDNK